MTETMKAAQRRIGRIKTELALAEAKADYWTAQCDHLEEDLKEAAWAAEQARLNAAGE